MRRLVALLALAAVPAAAQQTPAVPPPRFPVVKDTVALRFSADAGFVQASGNASVTTFNAGQQLSARLSGGRLEQQFSLVYGRSDSTTTANLLRGTVRYIRTVTDGLGVYVLGAFDRNTPAGIARRFEEGAGLSWTAVDAPRHRLVLDGGLSLFQQRGTAMSGGASMRFSSARFGALYQHRFTQKARFTQTVELLPNLEDGADLRLNTESVLVAPLSRLLAMRLSYVLRYDGLPEDGLGTTDRLLTSGLQFSI